MPTRVLFVCLGNICRSPMAEGVFRHLVKEAGRDEEFEIDSCGTAAYHVGERADPRTIQLLAGKGIPCDSVARKVHRDDFAHFDHILAMDRSNLRNLNQVCPPRHAHKLALVLGDQEVPDPYYGGPDGFELNYRQLDASLRAFLERV